MILEVPTESDANLALVTLLSINFVVPTEFDANLAFVTLRSCKLYVATAS